MPKYKTQTNDLTEIDGVINLNKFEVIELTIGDFINGSTDIIIPHEGIFKINIESKTIQQWLPDNGVFIGTYDNNAIINFDQSIQYILHKNIYEILAEVTSMSNGKEQGVNGVSIGLNILYDSTNYLLSEIYVSYFNHIMTIYTDYEI